MNQYLYRIQPFRPEMLSEGPTPDEQRIVGEHFAYLQEMMRNGVVILAGRTQNTDYSSFGLVIYRAENDAAARLVAQNDPAVKQKVFRAEVFPYAIALFEPQNV